MAASIGLPPKPGKGSKDRATKVVAAKSVLGLEKSKTNKVPKLTTKLDFVKKLSTYESGESLGSVLKKEKK